MIVVGVLVLALGGLLALALYDGGGGPDTGRTPPDTGKGNGNGGPPKVVDPVKVPPPAEEKPLFPAGAQPDGAEIEDTAGGKYVRWVTVESGAGKARFRFIPAAVGTDGKQVGPFYVTEEKVSNRLYSATADGLGPSAPAVGMSRTEAEAFATRLHPAGRLPTPEEWDAAAGFLAKPRPESLTKSGGAPVTNVAKPAASRKGSPTADVNVFGLLDMAGNGCEWTAGTLPGDPPRAITRGRNFLFRDPLTFAVLAAEQTEPKAAFANRGNKYTGFRVVIPVGK